MSDTWTPPAPGLTLKPDLVKGSVTTAAVKPDRFFYILSGETVWEVDGYRVGPPEAPDDAPELKWTFNLVCPKCGNNLLLDGEKKKIKVHRNCGIESLEFRCSYPAQFGGLCSFGVALELPRRRENREVTVNGGRRVKIDAIAKKL